MVELATHEVWTESILVMESFFVCHGFKVSIFFSFGRFGVDRYVLQFIFCFLKTSHSLISEKPWVVSSKEALALTLSSES